MDLNCIKVSLTLLLQKLWKNGWLNHAGDLLGGKEMSAAKLVDVGVQVENATDT